MLTDTQAREAFHFTLLRRLVEQVPEGLRLKWGVNLRLFFASVRYSEDMVHGHLDTAIALSVTPEAVGPIQTTPAPPKPRRSR